MSQLDSKKEFSSSLGLPNTWTNAQKELDLDLYDFLFCNLPLKITPEVLDQSIIQYFDQSRLTRDDAIVDIVKDRFLRMQTISEEMIADSIKQAELRNTPPEIITVPRAVELADTPLDQDPIVATEKILAGEQIFLFHRLRQPGDLLRIQEEGFQSNYSFEHNDHSYHPIHLSITPPSIIDPRRDLVISFQEEIFDHRTTNTVQATQLIDKGFAGHLNQFHSRSMLANSNIEVILYDGDKYIPQLQILERFADKLTFNHLINLIDGDKNDDQVFMFFADLEFSFPLAVKRLHGTTHDIMHRGNMYEHTLETLARLDTTTLNKLDREIARWAAIFHDTGKIEYPHTRDHRLSSTKHAVKYLRENGVDPGIIRKVAKQVRFHDQIGLILQGKSIKELVKVFPTRSELDIHYAISKADIACTFPRELPNIEDIYLQASSMLNTSFS